MRAKARLAGEAPSPLGRTRPWYVGLLSRLVVGQLARFGIAKGSRRIDRAGLAALQRPVPASAGEAVTRADFEYPAADGGCRNTARLYTPSRWLTADGRAAEGDAVTAPLVVFLHGGGWCLNDARSQPYDAFCAQLAPTLGWPVLSLNYRLAPEHPFPAGVEDVFAALLWLVERADVAPRGDRRRVVLMGESSGANLAAAAALMCRDRRPAGLRVVHQVLISPCFLCRPLLPSRVDPQRADGAFLPAWLMAWLEERYAGARSVEELAREPYANPLAAPSLRDLPALTGVVADGEVLRDEGLAYFAALAAAGVDADWREFAQSYHSFPVFPFGRAQADAKAFIVARLRGFFRAERPRRGLPRAQLGTGFEFDDGEQLLVSVQKPIGMVLEEGGGGRGCIVAEVAADSPASRAGVEAGFRLLAVNNMDVTASGLEAVMQLLREAPRVVNLRLLKEEV